MDRLETAILIFICTFMGAAGANMGLFWLPSSISKARLFWVIKTSMLLEFFAAGVFILIGAFLILRKIKKVKE